MPCNRVRLTRSLWFGAVITLWALAIVGCNAPPRALSTDLPVASGLRWGSSGSVDNWPTFAYDYTRSGLNPDVTNITRENVSKLQLRWQVKVAYGVFSSPVVYDGNLIVVSQGGVRGAVGSVVYDFSTTDGHQIWKYRMGGEGEMTPTIDPAAGLVIVGNEVKTNRKTSPSYVFALSLLDGSLLWKTAVNGIERAAPVVTGGTVYVGRAGGDPPGCVQGGVSAINESTGQTDWTWNVDQYPDEGGSVWGAIAYDGVNLIFGTGNTCQTPVMTANGAVALDPSDGSVVWNMTAQKDSHYDSDTGGGVMLLSGLAHFINKNGVLYAVNQETGNIEWHTALNPYTREGAWRGGFTTPTTDGTTIIEGSGLYKLKKSDDDGGEFCQLAAVKPTEVYAGYYSKVQGVDLNGHILWAHKMQNRLVGYVAVVPGVGFLGLNEDFVALNLKNGRELWTYKIPNYVNASMIVVQSGVYGADEAGNVYAFALPTTASRRR